jgi:CubicO group peptidase (beta-lactamase class C family)
MAPGSRAIAWRKILASRQPPMEIRPMSLPLRFSPLSSAVLALILAFAAPAAPALAQAADLADRASRVRELDAAIARAAVEWEVPGLAVAVVKDGQVVLARGYGVRQLGRPEPVDADTLFAVGSTTKAMTAALIGQLVAEGKVAWDDPVIRHLPGFQVGDPWATREITVRDLLTHRAGLPNTDLLWFGSDRSRAALVAALAGVAPAYSLRSSFIYQNVMYVTAGELAAAAAGAPWEQLLESRLLQPLGMARTSPTLAGAAGRDNVAAPHDRVEGALRVIENAPVDAVGPAGSVWSSVNDMSRWLRLLLAEGRVDSRAENAGGDGRQVLAAATVEELFRPQTVIPADQFYPTARLTRPHWITYGLGWFQQDFQGRMVQYHTGSIDGMTAIVGLVPEEELGLVVLANRDHAELRHALLWLALDRLGPRPSGRDWNAEVKQLYDARSAEADKARSAAEAKRVAGTRPSLPPARYAGTYRHPLYGDVLIRLEDRPEGGGLRLVFGPLLQGRLEHWHYDTFRVRWDRPWQAPELLTVGLDAEGNPARLELFGEELRRVPDEPAAAAP